MCRWTSVTKFTLFSQNMTLRVTNYGVVIGQLSARHSNNQGLIIRAFLHKKKLTWHCATCVNSMCNYRGILTLAMEQSCHGTCSYIYSKVKSHSIVYGGFEWISINLSKSASILTPDIRKTTSTLLRISLKGISKFNEIWPLEGALYITLW